MDKNSQQGQERWLRDSSRGPELVPSTHIQQLTTTCNSNSRGK